jgi:hypothetical protein
MKYGIPVPPAFVVPTYVYSLHIEKAGVGDLIDEVFSSDLRDEAIREAAKPKLKEIHEKIMETSLMEEVVDNQSPFSMVFLVLLHLPFVLPDRLQILLSLPLLGSMIHSCTRQRRKISLSL